MVKTSVLLYDGFAKNHFFRLYGGKWNIVEQVAVLINDNS